jgi:hypothetical protein
MKICISTLHCAVKNSVVVIINCISSLIFADPF